MARSPKTRKTRTPSRNAVAGKIHEIRKGLAIYKVNASPYYRARMWAASQSKYIVKSTKETTKAAAIEAAEAMFDDLRAKRVIGAVAKSLSFETYAEKLVARQEELAAQGHIHPQHAKNDAYILKLNDGLLAYFGRRDVTKIRSSDITEYLSWLRKTRGRNLAPSTLNKYLNVLRKTLKLAVEEGVLSNLPAIAMVPRQDNPRPFFRFEPLTTPENDQVAKLIAGAEVMAEQGVVVRGLPVTLELRDFIRFMLGSFLRPTLGEVFSLQHRHITVAKDDLPRLIIRVPKGKTGYREVITLSECVGVYDEIRRRNRQSNDNDFVFFPTYSNRETANRKLQEQFNLLLNRTGLKIDHDIGQAHSVYSLRHTAICMRIIKSDAQVNVLTLARNAGTSVDQIERFYAARLPLSKEMARNLQIDPAKVQPTIMPEPGSALFQSFEGWQIIGELKRPNTTLNPRDLRPTIKVVQPKAKDDC